MINKLKCNFSRWFSHIHCLNYNLQLLCIIFDPVLWYILQNPNFWTVWRILMIFLPQVLIGRATVTKQLFFLGLILILADSRYCSSYEVKHLNTDSKFYQSNHISCQISDGVIGTFNSAFEREKRNFGINYTSFIEWLPCSMLKKTMTPAVPQGETTPSS